MEGKACQVENTAQAKALRSEGAWSSRMGICKRKYGQEAEKNVGADRRRLGGGGTSRDPKKHSLEGFVKKLVFMQKSLRKSMEDCRQRHVRILLAF